MFCIRDYLPAPWKLIATICLFAGACCARAAEIQVFAAASLTDAMAEVATAYRAVSSDTLRFNLAGSNALARQIQEGAPADVFISADNAKMNSLETAGLLLDGTRRSLLGNTLVIVVGSSSPLVIASAKSLAQPKIHRIALADPKGVPAGIYAKEYLEKSGVWESVKDRVIPTENVRAALAVVESGDVDAGIVYRTDAAISKAVRIAYHVPVHEGPEISYPAAVMKNSGHPNEARSFLEFLASEHALA
ncbi:MAG: molybdate ABC transporter substrate-binding protein, partial [Chthoniobacterales bacterium]